LKQGLALTDEYRIEIHRENKGSVIDYGEVDIEKGTYAIKLTNLEGHICARLRGSKYETIGEGCFSLDRVKLGRKTGVNGPLLSISRSKDALAFDENSNGESGPLPVKVADASKSNSQENGKDRLYREQNIKPTTQSRIIDFYDSDNADAETLKTSIQSSVQNSEDPNSTVILSISSPNHPTVRTVANAYTPSRGMAVPNNKTRDALRKLAEDAGVADPNAPGGTVWGKAMREGRATAGVEVEIEGREDLKPLYLNEFYIPDPNQKSTASHGLYTFVGVPDGEFSVRASQNKEFVGFQNISVRDNELSIADIDSTQRKRPVRVSIYDLINKTSQSAVVTLQNYEEDVVVENGQADVNVQDNYDTAFALVNPLDKRYMSSQFVLNPGEDLYNFPLIPSEWVESMIAQAKLERPVREKVVLGIGSQRPFRVQAVGSKTAQVFYFNSEGKVTEGQYGSAGGGFFIIDPENEVTEYAIQAAGEHSVRVIYMPAIPNVLNVIQM
jgi:uridine kinase